MPNLGPSEILIVLLIILLLFGANKLPDLARSMGRSARIFKSEVKEMRREDMEDPAPARQGELPPSQEARSATQTAQPAQPDDFWDRPETQPRQL